jgi:hypothetical protein
MSENAFVGNLKFLNLGLPNMAECFLAKKLSDIAHLQRYWHFRQYGDKNKVFRSKN